MAKQKRDSLGNRDDGDMAPGRFSSEQLKSESMTVLLVGSFVGALLGALVITNFGAISEAAIDIRDRFVSSLQPDHSVMDETLGQVQTALGNVESQWSGIQQEVTALQTRLRDAESLFACESGSVCSRDIMDLRTFLERNEGDHAIFRQEISALNDVIRILEDRILTFPEVEDEVTRLRVELQSLESEITVSPEWADIKRYVSSALKDHTADATFTAKLAGLSDAMQSLENQLAATPDWMDVKSYVADVFHSNDVVDLRDYALFSTGADVIEEWTSPAWKKSSDGSVVRDGFIPRGGSSFSVITSDLTVGRCWCFKGTKGHLAISLTQHLVISHITIDHSSRKQAGKREEAPCEIEIWGILDDDSFDPASDSFVISNLSELSGEPRAIRLATFSYDFNSELHIQTFPVDNDTLRAEISVKKVVVMILSNSGHPEFTCVYRVRIHSISADTQEVTVN